VPILAKRIVPVFFTLIVAGSASAPAGDLARAADPTQLIPTPEVPKSIVLETKDRALLRRHRGDWEPSNAVLFTYSGYWEDSISVMVEAAQHEVDVFVLTPTDELLDARKWVKKNRYLRDRVQLIPAKLDTPWVRDYGPFQIVDVQGRVKWVDALYSGARPKDDRVPSMLAKKLGVPVENVSATLDGGGLISNGSGLCVMTRESLDDSGVTTFDDEEQDAVLRKLGCAVMAVVPALANEATGHVDMFAQFLSARRLLISEVDREAWDEDHVRLEEALRGIRAAAKKLGVELEVIRIPLPMPAYDRYRSYVNGLRLPKSFLVPSYGDVDPAVEQQAYEILQGAMPGVTLTPIPADRMIELEGAIHCVSQGLMLPTKVPLARSKNTVRTCDRSSACSG
jgi:agmatine/peptidylarginine deiminase